MTRLAQHGLRVSLPAGWEGSVFRRQAALGETTHPLLHASTCPLPPGRGDFGSGVVETLGPDDVFVALLEYHPDSVSTALFAARGLPDRLRPDDFSGNALQRRLRGQAGVQRFFSSGGRAFCLYVVLGSFARRAALTTVANTLVQSIEIEAGLPSYGATP